MATASHNFSVELPSSLKPFLSELKVCIITAQWNQAITTSLKEGAVKRLEEVGISKKQIDFFDVPGTFELSYAANLAVNSEVYFDAIICIGCVIKGETDHDIYISHAVAQGITQLNIQQDIPIIFCVLTTNNYKQAEERSGGALGNKGSEAADTALQMIHLRKTIK